MSRLVIIPAWSGILVAVWVLLLLSPLRSGAQEFQNNQLYVQLRANPYEKFNFQTNTEILGFRDSVPSCAVDKGCTWTRSLVYTKEESAKDLSGSSGTVTLGVKIAIDPITYVVWYLDASLGDNSRSFDVGLRFLSEILPKLAVGMGVTGGMIAVGALEGEKWARLANQTYTVAGVNFPVNYALTPKLGLEVSVSHRFSLDVASDTAHAEAKHNATADDSVYKYYLDYKRTYSVTLTQLSVGITYQFKQLAF